MQEITINITSCGRWHELRRLIESLRNQIPLQVVLTQDVEVPSEFRKCIIGHAANAPLARNKLWENTKTPYALFLDEDCEIASDAYFHYLKQRLAFIRHPSIALGGNYESKSGQSLLQKAYNLVTQIWTLRNSTQAILFLGGHFALYKKTEDRRPLFDQDTEFGGEEFNLLQNLRTQSFSIAWDPELRVIHHPSASWGHFFQRAKQHAKTPGHPTPITKDYLWSLGRLCIQSSLPVVGLSFTYLCLVYFFRFLFRASLIKVPISSSKESPELLAERAKSSIGSKFGLALASRKNK